jgi:hypothetical protein
VKLFHIYILATVVFLGDALLSTVGEDCTEELHNLYFSPSIIRMIKSRRVRFAGHVARTGRKGMHIGYWWENQNGRHHWKTKS